jgi:choline-sulfatase
MGGNHGLMSKCVLYEPAVHVPLIVQPPNGCAPRVVDALVEHVDVPATLRDIAGAPELPASVGRSFLGEVRAGGTSLPAREVAISENWGFASFETAHHKLVVDEDACAPCQLFDLDADPNEDADLLGDPHAAPIVEQLMETYVRPFLRIAPARPHRSPFTG